MPVQHPAVEGTLRQLPNNIQNIVKSGLENWEQKNKALTRAILAGLHRVPAPAKFGLGLIPQTKFIFTPVFTSGSCLEWLIIQLAEHAARKGTLTEENRKDFENFISYRSVSLPKSSTKR
jgi:hypothetical protein